MALVFADRVQETSTTTGTGTYSLAGAVTGYQTFVAGIGNANTCYYCATDGTDWEVGLGTVTDATPDTLARTTVYQSSNADAAVNWAAGTRTIFCTIPADSMGVDVQTFTSSGTWTKPKGRSNNSVALLRAWGGGGSGGKGASSSPGGGGGGGAFIERWVLLSAMGATETITIGAGGVAQTTASTNGNAGGDTTIGSLLTAFGGGGGEGSSSVGNDGGGAGTLFAAGATPANMPEGATGANGDFFQGGQGGAASSGAPDTFGAGGKSVNGGGGGGAGSDDASPGPGAGGDSLYGGDGGAGAFDASTATSGTQPSGGGGGSETGTSGAGAAGQVIIYVFP